MSNQLLIILFLLSLQLSNAQISYREYAIEAFEKKYVNHRPDNYSDKFYDDVYPFDPEGFLNRGIEKYNDGFFWEALKDIKECVALAENDFAYGHFWLGLCFDALEKPDTAKKHYQLAIKQEPLLVEARANLGVHYLQENKRDSSLFQFEKAIEIAPKYATAYYYRGILGLLDGKLGKYLRNMRKARKIDPTFAPAHLMLAQFDISRGYNSEALKDINKALKYSPDLAEGYFWRSVLQIDKKKKEATAIADLNKAIELDSENEVYYFFRALIRIKKEEYSTAVDDLMKNYSLNPSNRDDYKGKLQYHDKRIDIEYALKYYSDNRFRMSLKIREELQKAICYFFINDYEKSRASCEVVTKSNNQLAAAHLLRGLSFEYEYTQMRFNRNKELLQEALKEYEIALKLDEDIYDAHKKLGILNLEKGLFEFANKHFEEMMRIDTTAKLPYRFRGLSRLQEQLYEMAAMDFSQFLIHDSLDTDILYNRANCYKNIGEYSEAIEDYNKIISRKHDPFSLLESVECFYFLNEKDSAMVRCDSILLGSGSYISSSEIFIQALGFRSLLFLEKKEYSKSIEDLKFILERKPFDYMANLRMAECLIGEEEYLEAIKVLDDIAKLTNTDFKFFYLKAIVKSKLGQYTEACELLRLATQKGLQIRKSRFEEICKQP